MSNDLDPGVTFNQWQDYFKIALGGTASRAGSADEAVKLADEIATKAVALVHERVPARSPPR